jgi:hypothetical protein
LPTRSAILSWPRSGRFDRAVAAAIFRAQVRRGWLNGRLVTALAAGCLAFAAVGPSAVAVHDDNLFELGPAQGADILSDANRTNGPDWAAPNGIFNADQSIADLFGGAAAAFPFDDTSQKGASDGTTFSGAGGSNKNNDPLSAADCAARVPPLTGSACDTCTGTPGTRRPRTIWSTPTPTPRSSPATTT